MWTCFTNFEMLPSRDCSLNVTISVSDILRCFNSLKCAHFLNSTIFVQWILIDYWKIILYMYRVILGVLYTALYLSRQKKDPVLCVFLITHCDITAYILFILLAFLYSIVWSYMQYMSRM